MYPNHQRERNIGTLMPFMDLLDDFEGDLVSLIQAKAHGEVPGWLPTMISLDAAIVDTRAMVDDLRTHLAHLCKDPSGVIN